jgi:multiple sugar transport system ATP-binding protein
MEQYLDRKPKALSGGQRQRVALGRAIVRQPKVFLFDEPLSNLDAKMRVQMRAEIMKLHERLQATMIYVTHDQIEAMTMGERIVMMSEGVIQQTAAPLSMYNAPENLFVAGFLGSPPMNFIRGTLHASKAGGVKFREDAGGTIELELGERPEASALVEKSVVLGVRPESCDIAVDPAATETFPVIVELVEPHGAETYIHANTGKHSLISRSHVPLDKHETGHRVKFKIDIQRAHIFDPASGQRVR